MASKWLLAIVVLTCMYHAGESQPVKRASWPLESKQKSSLDLMQDDEQKMTWQHQKAQQDQGIGRSKAKFPVSFDSQDSSQSSSHERQQFQPINNYRQRSRYSRLEELQPPLDYPENVEQFRRFRTMKKPQFVRPYLNDDDNANKIYKDN